MMAALAAREAAQAETETDDPTPVAKAEVEMAPDLVATVAPAPAWKRPTLFDPTPRTCRVVTVPPPTRGPAWLRTDSRTTALGVWADARPYGVWWADGLWTDRFPMPKEDQLVAGASTGAITPKDGHLWVTLRGQRVGEAAWVIALDGHDALICQWLVNIAHAPALMADLVGDGQPWPGDTEWTLTRPAAPAAGPVGQDESALPPMPLAPPPADDAWAF